MKNKTFLIVSFFLVLIVLVFHYTKEKKLTREFKQSFGVVHKVVDGKNGGGIHFTYKEFNGDYKPLTWNGSDCNEIVRRDLVILQKYKFPVVYLSSDHTNAEILLFESQYKRFGLDIPEELINIVSELSICEK